MEMPNKKIRIIFAIGALLILAGLFLMYRSYENGSFDENKDPLETITPSPITQEIIITPNDFSLPIYVGIPVSQLNPDPQIVNQISSVVFAAHKKNLKDLEEKVVSQPTDINSWLAAAALKNFFNDFAGAKDIWEYVIKIAPEEPTAYNNLGNLAKLRTNNLTAAENYFKIAISKDKNFIPTILDLAELYWAFLPDRQADAIKTLENGLIANPNEVNLMINLGGYYRELGNKEKSLEYFRRALVLYPNDVNLENAVKEAEAYLR